MGLAWDAAEAINLLAGGAIGEASIRQQFEDAGFRHALKKDLKADLRGLGFLTADEIKAISRFVTSNDFARLLADGAPVVGDDDAIERILGRCTAPQQALVVRRFRQVSLRTLLRRSSIVDQVTMHMLHNIDEASLALINLGDDQYRLLSEIELRTRSAATEINGAPAPALNSESEASHEARSLLALTITAATRDLGVIVRTNAECRELVEWTGYALDMIIDDFECEVEQVLIVIHHTAPENRHRAIYGANESNLAAVNRRLRYLSADARVIADSLRRLELLPSSVCELLDTTMSIAVTEDSLAWTIHRLTEPHEIHEAGALTENDDFAMAALEEMTDALNQLMELRLNLRRDIAALVPQL